MTAGDGHTDGAGQPIGYNPTLYSAGVVPFGAPLADPRLVDGLTSPNTRRQDEGPGFGAGRGQAPSAASSARLLGLCATS